MRLYLLIFCCAIAKLSIAQKNILILGIAQDGGYPHLGCNKECCNKAWRHANQSQWITSIALVDHESRQWWLFEASPDMNSQLHFFDSITEHLFPYLPSGIFITHAHIGHYTGLMELGREVMNTKEVPVFVLPRMADFLTQNGPWSQLINLNNIKLHALTADSTTQLALGFAITPILVPHRDEFSETCGFQISATNMEYLFIPDIDKWDLWDKNIITEVGKVDIAFIDGTFNDSNELPGRNMAEIPHPFMEETLNVFSDDLLRSHICFIHFNHTNKAMWDAETQNNLKRRGVKLAETGSWY